MGKTESTNSQALRIYGTERTQINLNAFIVHIDPILASGWSDVVDMANGCDGSWDSFTRLLPMVLRLRIADERFVLLVRIMARNVDGLSIETHVPHDVDKARVDYVLTHVHILGCVC